MLFSTVVAPKPGCFVPNNTHFDTTEVRGGVTSCGVLSRDAGDTPRRTQGVLSVCLLPCA